MSKYYWKGLTYSLVSTSNGGQYAGPCPWSGGTDRFIVEPVNQYWLCRSSKCIGCTHGYQKGSYRYGRMDDAEPAKPIKQVKRSTSVDLELAKKFNSVISDESIAYLRSRGLSDNTIHHFLLGTTGYTVTIPLIFTWNGETKCHAIKRRWLPQYKPDDMSSYMMIKGSIPKGIFNFDVLSEKHQWGCIANSLFDAMILHQIGVPVIAPFAGEANWEEKWVKLIPWKTIINIWDLDEEIERNGHRFRPGDRYALHRASKLYGKKVVNSYAPGGYTDVNEAYIYGENLRVWINELIGSF